jgi:hypothetical protein
MYHKTDSGYVELVASWGHGKGARYNTRPCHIITNDDDGHYDLWRVTGKMKDAAYKIASLMRCQDRIITYESGYLTAESTPDDFWNDELEPNLEKYPNTVRY